MKENWKSYWHDAARAMKRAVISRGTVRLAGDDYRVAYEARRKRTEADELFLKEAARGRKCIFDAGANVGTTALIMASSMSPDGVLYAFEASESSCLTIRENMLLNGLGNKVHIVNALVDERSGRAAEFHWDFVSVQASALMESRSGTSIQLLKAAISLDDFIASSGVTPDFVKIDVEGAEGRVISGMARLLQNVRPLIYLELHAWPEMTVSQNVDAILVPLNEARYQMVHLRTKQRLTSGEPLAQMRKSAAGVEFRTRVMLLPEEAELPPLLRDFDTAKL